MCIYTRQTNNIQNYNENNKYDIYMVRKQTIYLEYQVCWGGEGANNLRTGAKSIYTYYGWLSQSID